LGEARVPMGLGVYTMDPSFAYVGFPGSNTSRE